MDDKSRKVTGPGVRCLFKPSGSGDSCTPQPCAPTASQGVVFGSHAAGTIVNSATHQGGLEFGSTGGYGPRLDLPGPMMHSVRDPALSLIALSGVDPEGRVMVEIPPVADPGHLINTPPLAGSRIGFASEYVTGDVRKPAKHSPHFARVLDVLRAAGAQLVPVTARVTDDTRHFTLDPGNEINDRVTENRLDGVVADAQGVAFHKAATADNPRFSVPAGTDVDGVSRVVWFYGAHWSRDRLAALVRGCQQVLARL